MPPTYRGGVQDMTGKPVRKFDGTRPAHRSGDIIVTETDAEEPLSVAVGGGPHVRAKPGACRGRKAIRLSEEP